MTPSEDDLARRIIKELDQGVDHIDPATRERLSGARDRALRRYRETGSRVFGLAWAGQAISKFPVQLNVRHAIVLAALLLLVTGLALWSNLGPANEIAEIDAGLLTDELPINAYIDKGFESWLKRGSR